MPLALDNRPNPYDVRAYTSEDYFDLLGKHESVQGRARVGHRTAVTVKDCVLEHEFLEGSTSEEGPDDGKWPRSLRNARACSRRPAGALQRQAKKPHQFGKPEAQEGKARSETGAEGDSGARQLRGLRFPTAEFLQHWHAKRAEEEDEAILGCRLVGGAQQDGCRHSRGACQVHGSHVANCLCQPQQCVAEALRGSQGNRRPPSPGLVYGCLSDTLADVRARCPTCAPHCFQDTGDGLVRTSLEACLQRCRQHHHAPPAPHPVDTQRTPRRRTPEGAGHRLYTVQSPDSGHWCQPEGAQAASGKPMCAAPGCRCRRLRVALQALRGTNSNMYVDLAMIASSLKQQQVGFVESRG